MDMTVATRVSLLVTGLLFSQQIWCAPDRFEIDFPNHARLVYSAPVSPALRRTFGQGWTHLTVTRPDGSTLPIMPDETLGADGSVIFSTVGANARSRDGRYVVLDVTRNGVTETEDSKPSVESRAFCPILDTRTGCVARDDTGAVCAGAWDDKNAVWHSQLDSGKTVSQSMTTLEKPTAKAVWTQFGQARSPDIKPFLRVALGFENLLACDPPNAENAGYYAQIRTALGPGAHAASDRSAGGSVPADVGASPTWTVKADRSWLYGRPSVGSNRHGYLIRGDHVAVIGEQKPDWVKVRYARSGNPPIEAWLKREDVSSLTIAAQQSELRFHLPGGATIVYSKPVNPQDSLPERVWKTAVFRFPNGTSFGLLPRAGESNADAGTQTEPPSDSNISPSGQYVVVARDEQGTVSTGPGQPESEQDREYCSMIEIRTGCITADQTGEICGAGWQAGRPAQWGTDEQTRSMLTSDRPSASRQLAFIRAGQPPKLTILDDSGADNLLRCDPPSQANRETYRKIATALEAAGAHSDARLIGRAISNAGDN